VALEPGPEGYGVLSIGGGTTPHISGVFGAWDALEGVLTPGPARIRLRSRVVAFTNYNTPRCPNVQYSVLLPVNTAIPHVIYSLRQVTVDEYPSTLPRIET
jgi:hypothetical protein